MRSAARRWHPLASVLGVASTPGLFLSWFASTMVSNMASARGEPDPWFAPALILLLGALPYLALLALFIFRRRVAPAVAGFLAPYALTGVYVAGLNAHLNAQRAGDLVGYLRAFSSTLFAPLTDFSLMVVVPLLFVFALLACAWAVLQEQRLTKPSAGLDSTAA